MRLNQDRKLIVLILRCDRDGDSFSPSAGKDQVGLGGRYFWAGKTLESELVSVVPGDLTMKVILHHQQDDRGLAHRRWTQDSSRHPLLAEQLVSIPTLSLTFGLLFTVLSPSRYGTARTLMTEQSLHLCVQKCVSFGALGNVMRSYWIYLKTGEGAVVGRC